MPYPHHINASILQEERLRMVRCALQEDLGQGGDITGRLISPHATGTATIVTRDPLWVCGLAWVESVFALLPSFLMRTLSNDAAIAVSKPICIKWDVAEGHFYPANTTLAYLSGPVQALLAGERCALNFLQCLSGITTTTRQYVSVVESTGVGVLDTRKTLPGLRLAQKYAVHCGGGVTHRMGLYDAFLIKENHIAASGGIAKAIERARHYSGPHVLSEPCIVEVEVETLSQLQIALYAEPDVILLDNFSLDGLCEAVDKRDKMGKNHILFEVSGSVSLSNIKDIAHTGVEYISVGALTKHLRAIDLSMRLH